MILLTYVIERLHEFYSSQEPTENYEAHNVRTLMQSVVLLQCNYSYAGYATFSFLLSTCAYDNDPSLVDIFWPIFVLTCQT